MSETPSPPDPPDRPEDPTHPMPADDAPTEAPPRRLLRSGDDKVIGGVCSGLARYFGIDPLIVRIAAVALSFVGGVAVVAYVLALAFVPQDDGHGHPTTERRSAIATAVGAAVIILAGIVVLDGGWGWGDWFFAPLVPLAIVVALLAVAGRRLLRSRGQDRPPVSRIIGAGLLVVAAVIAAFLAALGSAWATAAGGGIAIAAVVIALGVAMVGLSFRHRSARWLAVPALVLALPAGVVSAADIDLDGGIGSRTYRPATTADLKAGGYELGTGELVVDLRRTTWPTGDPVHLKVDVGIGHALVLVPTDVCVQSDAHVGMGYLDILGDDNGGADIDDQRGTVQRYDGPKLVLDADVGLGALEVRHSRHDDGDGPGFRHRDADTQIAPALANAGCAGDPA